MCGLMYPFSGNIIDWFAQHVSSVMMRAGFVLAVIELLDLERDAEANYAILQNWFLDPVGDSSVTTDVIDEVDAVVDKDPPLLDPALVGILAASFGSPPGNETSIFTSIMNEIITLPVPTITHIPRNVCPLLAQVFCKELQNACKDDIWGFVRLSLLPKAVLRPPPRGGRKKHYVVAKHIME